MSRRSVSSQPRKEKGRSSLSSIDTSIDTLLRHKQETPLPSRSIQTVTSDMMPSHTKAREPARLYNPNSRTSFLSHTAKISPMINVPWRDRPKRKFRPPQNGPDKLSKNWLRARLKLLSPRMCLMQLVRQHMFAILLVIKGETAEHLSNGSSRCLKWLRIRWNPPASSTRKSLEGHRVRLRLSCAVHREKRRLLSRKNG